MLSLQPIAPEWLPRATLKQTANNAAITGQTIVFKNGTTTACTAQTDASGVATCAVRVVAPKGFTATYDGTNNYLPSMDKGTLI
jgi:hypothetical protein